jgi:hypothetical protein
MSHAAYVQIVGRALCQDWYALDQCEALIQLEAIEHLVATYPERFFSRGWAVRALLDKAMDQVIAVTRAQADPRTRRIAEYLAERRAGRTVAEIAAHWRLSRECVSRTIGCQAVRLVTDRFLALARRTFTLKASVGATAPDAEAPATPRRIA